MMYDGNFTTYIEYEDEEIEVEVSYEYCPPEESTNSPCDMQITCVEYDGEDLEDVDDYTIENLIEQAYNYMED